MGFFSRLFTAGPALNRLAKTCDKCLEYVEAYHFSHDFNDVIRAAWLLHYGILSSIEKWNWQPSVPIYIPNRQMLGRIPILQATGIIIAKITRIAEKEGKNDLIRDIMDGGQTYGRYSDLCPEKLKKDLKP